MLCAGYFILNGIVALALLYKVYLLFYQALKEILVLMNIYSMFSPQKVSCEELQRNLMVYIRSQILLKVKGEPLIMFSGKLLFTPLVCMCSKII